MEKETNKFAKVGTEVNGGHGRGGGGGPVVDDPVYSLGSEAGLQEGAGTSEAEPNLRSGFICDICGKEMLIAEDHLEINGSDFPACRHCADFLLARGCDHDE